MRQIIPSQGFIHPRAAVELYPAGDGARCGRAAPAIREAVTPYFSDADDAPPGNIRMRPALHDVDGTRALFGRLADGRRDGAAADADRLGAAHRRVARSIWRGMGVQLRGGLWRALSKGVAAAADAGMGGDGGVGDARHFGQRRLKAAQPPAHVLGPADA